MTAAYTKSPEDKHVLIPSEDAPLVYEIFQRIADGETQRQVCDDFNARGIITPSQRLNGNDPEHPNRVPVSTTWNTTTINQMLDNMVYAGHMVQGKRRNESYDSGKRIVVPPEEHIVVWDTHEAIIPAELWNAVQARRKGRSSPRKTKQTPEISLFAGFVMCADCEGVLAAQNGKGILRCAKYNNGGAHACSSHTIRQDALEAIVLADIQGYAELAAEDEKSLTDKLYAAMIQGEQQDIKSRASRISNLKQKLEGIQAKIERLYDEKFEKGMDETVFKSMLSRYEADKTACVDTLHTLEMEAAKTKGAEESIASFMAAIKNAISIETLDRRILSALIEKIVVHEREKVDGKIHQQVEIHYKFVGSLAGLQDM